MDITIPSHIQQQAIHSQLFGNMNLGSKVFRYRWGGISQHNVWSIETKILHLNTSAFSV